MGFAVLALVLLCGSAVAESKPDPKAAWIEFTNKFGRRFSNDVDEQKHYEAFKSNLDIIEVLKRDDPSAKYSYMTPFADVTPEEFRSTHLGLRVDHSNPSVADADVVLSGSLPDAFDWRTKGAVNPVKDQGQCGSCWAFATVANIEGVNFVNNKQLVSLSEQELVDCSKSDNGCGGGLPSSAYQDMIKNHLGLELETDYPYTAEDGTCTAKSALEKVFIQGFKNIGQDEDQIAAALIQYGPLAIGINAGPMQMYSGGISDPSSCDPSALDHGVAIVGFGVESAKKYWTIRNSWGASWGEQGYYRIIRGVGKCGLNTMVTTATMTQSVITV